MGYVSFREGKTKKNVADLSPEHLRKQSATDGTTRDLNPYAHCSLLQVALE